MKKILLIFAILLIGFISAQVGSHNLPSDLLDTCSDGITYCFAKWASDVTTGMFWVFALLSFTIIILIASMRFGSPRAFGFASFIGMIGGVWLAVLQLIPWWVGSSFIIIGIGGLVVLIINEKN